VKRSPIIVTRAGAPGAELARALGEAGEDSLWLPAFTLGPAPDEGRVTAVLARLATFDLAIFVSPAAVEASASLLPQPWPSKTAIGVVGEGTRRALLARVAGAAGATLFAPGHAEPDGEGSGSEPLWQQLQPAIGTRGGTPGGIRRALILRAEQGREWLAGQMRAAGGEVETLAVYTRRAAEPAADAVARVRAWRAANQRAVLLVASSEAVDVVASQLDAVAGPAWTRSARVLAPHARIAERLRGAGFADVAIATFDVEAIRKAAFAQ
jgi:uroporphyrinogen-III synthase